MTGKNNVTKATRVSTVSLSVTMKKVSAAQGGFCCVYFVGFFLFVSFIFYIQYWGNQVIKRNFQLSIWYFEESVLIKMDL